MREFLYFVSSQRNYEPGCYYQTKIAQGGESAAPVSDNYQNVTPIDAIFTTMDSIRVDYLSGGEKFREKCCCKWQVRGIVKKAHPEIKICTVET